ncbi:MAG: radical SAM protein [Alphaproteobacteria bacterium]
MNVVAPIAKPLDPAKFRDPLTTAKGERRAAVTLGTLETLWFNTGTLCNLTCRNCYIESSPRNDALVYLTIAEVDGYLDEVAGLGLPTHRIGFTGGEPFMNRDIVAMLDSALRRGFDALVLTNAMRPMMKLSAPLLGLRDRHGDRLVVRVSVDHHTKELHEAERGPRSWKPTIDGLRWLAANGFRVDVAGRTCWGEPEPRLRQGYARLFAEQGLALDAEDPARLVLFPEMDARVDVPEITEACWGLLGKSPADVMCANSRMVVRRKGDVYPVVVPCTLLPYDPRFTLGRSLAEAAGPVPLNHPHCAKFCVLGGGTCSRG